MAAERKAGKGAGTGKKAGQKGKARQARGGLATPVTADSALAAVVGKQSMTRAELTKKVWDYVKKNDLQDPKDRRSIRADEKLKPIFGGKDRVNMFEMTKLVNQHVTSA